MLLPPLDLFVTLEWLEKGIARFRSFSFDADFHNARYARYFEWRKKGITAATWTRLADELQLWGALRGIALSDIVRQTPERLEDLDSALKTLLQAHPRQDPTLDSADWSELESLFEAARNIETGKGTPIDSPVLPSKLCHLLVPSAYPVSDNAFIGVAHYPYREYWAVCKDGWQRGENKEALKARLRTEIEGRHGTVVSEYPWSAKITELCYAAYRNK